MPINTTTLVAIVIMSVVTLLTRALPFFIFPANKPTPKIIKYLGRVLPFAIIGMIVVYCFKDSAIIEWPYFLPEIIAAVAIVAVHKWKHNLLISIGGGTVLYMLLVQFVFK